MKLPANLGSRKFLLALIFTLASVGGLFAGKISGGEWIATITAILGLYGGANVLHAHVTQGPQA